jgi:hypothetical protein
MVKIADIGTDLPFPSPNGYISAASVVELEANANVMASSKDLLKALEDVLMLAERNHCDHSETHRGGTIWEICAQCGSKWADDEGGKPEHIEPIEFHMAHKAIAKAYGESP